MSAHAELVLLEAAVHTVDPSCPRAEAVAVAGGHIAAVGGEDDVRDLIGPDTVVMTLGGRTVLPGFQDAHVHFAHGGMAGLTCSLFESAVPDEHFAAVAAYAAANPGAEWIVGGGWSMDDFGGPMPTAAMLDAVVPDRPVALWTRDAHSVWANSAALVRAGITAATPDPPGGVIDRDASGAPSGTLQENAIRLVAGLIPPTPPTAWEDAIRRAQAELHALGITACHEASLDAELFEPYRAVAARGELTMRLEASLYWDDRGGDDQLETLLEQRAAGTVGRLRMRGAKLFQDGVAESFTAAMLGSYRDASGAESGSHGLSLFEPERLSEVVARLDGAGFQVQVHAIGDRAVRETLDALQHAEAANGRRDARHHIAHVQFVHPDDVGRFASLGVVANVTPYWAVLSGYVEDLTLPFVSEEAGASMYAFGSLSRAGARLAFGSDWTVSTPDPMLQLEVAVNRRRPGFPLDKVLLAHERLELESAIEAATLGSAFVNHLDDVTGSITVGKLADLVVLDRDLFDRGAGEIHEARVILTLVEGETVYAASPTL